MTKLLFFDIETSPIVGYTWTLWEANVLRVLQPVKIISVAYKWLGAESITCLSLDQYKGYKPNVLNDALLMKDIWEVINEAEIVVGHNSDAFDLKHLNARFIANGLNLPSPYKTVDTKKAAKKYFQFGSNKLDYLGEYLGEGRKVDTGGFDLWVDCMKGDLSAWERMRTYNIQDVQLLERIYLRLRPFIKNHPDVSEKPQTNGLYCMSCSSTDIEKRGFSLTRTGKKQRIQCRTCRSWSLGPYVRAYT